MSFTLRLQKMINIKPRDERGVKDDFFRSQVFEEKDKSVLVMQISLRYLDIWMEVSRNIRVWITITQILIQYF